MGKISNVFSLVNVFQVIRILGRRAGATAENIVRNFSKHLRMDEADVWEKVKKRLRLGLILNIFRFENGLYRIVTDDEHVEVIASAHSLDSRTSADSYGKCSVDRVDDDEDQDKVDKDDAEDDDDKVVASEHSKNARNSVIPNLNSCSNGVDDGDFLNFDSTLDHDDADADDDDDEDKDDDDVVACCCQCEKCYSSNARNSVISKRKSTLYQDDLQKRKKKLKGVSKADRTKQLRWHKRRLKIIEEGIEEHYRRVRRLTLIGNYMSALKSGSNGKRKSKESSARPRGIKKSKPTLYKERSRESPRKVVIKTREPKKMVVPKPIQLSFPPHKQPNVNDLDENSINFGESDESPKEIVSRPMEQPNVDDLIQNRINFQPNFGDSDKSPKGVVVRPMEQPNVDDLIQNRINFQPNFGDSDKSPKGVVVRPIEKPSVNYLYKNRKHFQPNFGVSYESPNQNVNTLTSRQKSGNQQNLSNPLEENGSQKYTFADTLKPPTPYYPLQNQSIPNGFRELSSIFKKKVPEDRFLQGSSRIQTKSSQAKGSEYIKSLGLEDLVSVVDKPVTKRRLYSPSGSDDDMFEDDAGSEDSQSQAGDRKGGRGRYRTPDNSSSDEDEYYTPMKRSRL